MAGFLRSDEQGPTLEDTHWNTISDAYASMVRLDQQLQAKFEKIEMAINDQAAQQQSVKDIVDKWNGIAAGMGVDTAEKVNHNELRSLQARGLGQSTAP